MTKKEIIEFINKMEEKQYTDLERYQEEFGCDSHVANIQRARWAVLWSLKKAIKYNNSIHLSDYL